MKNKCVTLLSVVFLFCSCGRTIDIVSYNVGVFSKSEVNSTEMIADMLRKHHADYVGLCELDSCTVRTGGVFQLEELKNKLPAGYQMVFAPSMPFQGGKYGIGLLVGPSHRILNSELVHLPKGEGSEPRALCIAETEDIIFAVTHLEFSSVVSRMEQGHIVDSILRSRAKNSGKEVVLCGDFNATPQSEVIAMFMENWQIVSPLEYSYPSDAPRACIDYVFVLKNSRLRCESSSMVKDFDGNSPEQASDHLAVSVVLRE